MEKMNENSKIKKTKVIRYYNFVLVIPHILHCRTYKEIEFLVQSISYPMCTKPF